MNALERRISKIESKVLDKKHPGVFIIIRNNENKIRYIRVSCVKSYLRCI